MAIGAVPYGDRCACQTPLSGQRWPVDATVPIGFFVEVNMIFVFLEAIER
jgi:hypothetical protein